VRNIETPPDAIRALCEGSGLAVGLDPIDGGGDDDLSSSVAVEGEADEQVRPRLVGVAAQHPEAVDADGSRFDDPHRAGEADVGRRADRRSGVVGVAVHLEGERVLAAEVGESGDLERVGCGAGHRVTEVGAVEPQVSPAGEPLDDDPAPSMFLAGVEFESTAKHDRSLQISAETPRDIDQRPFALVEVRVDREAAGAVVYLGRSPLAVELHGGSVPTGSGSIGPGATPPYRFAACARMPRPSENCGSRGGCRGR